MKKTLISSLLIGILSVSMTFSSLPSNTAYADSFKSVTLGADLSEEQKQEMLKYFGVTSNEANVLEVTSKEEHEALDKVASSSQIGTKAISCSYIEPTTSGGLNIKTNNLTWVTESMIRNSLITAGIQNANVTCAAPFQVSGTAALAGILKGFENSSSGEKIDENKKEAANDEIVTTGNVGEKIGQDDAANLINDIKKDVVKKDPKTNEGVDKIVDKAVKPYEDKLSDDDIKQIKELMYKINDLDLNYKAIKDQLNDVTDSLKDKLTTEETKNIFQKIGDFFSDIWDSICNFFSGDSDSKDNNKATSTPTSEKSEKATSSPKTSTSTSK